MTEMTEEAADAAGAKASRSCSPGRQEWDESARPSAPPAPEGYVYSRLGRAVGQHLAEVHDHLRSELRQITELLRQVKDGAMAAGRARAMVSEMTLRRNNWTLGAYCASYCALVTGHHGLEDRAIFPHLRRSDAGLAPVIDRLEAEHVIIHEVLLDVDRALVRLVSEPEDFAEIEEAVEVLTQTLLSHLAYEEREITEPLSRYGFFAGQV
ncbi:MAG TPA: hemerythrin domain-containing protein [Streptosporangiaceae bacterium]|nr:hemerythrin domain-containing protein [Streptosporangiaceae bacterium]